MGVAHSPVDLAKLEDISADHIATLTSRQVFDAVRAWAVSYDPELVTVLATDSALALRALAVERESAVEPAQGPTQMVRLPACLRFLFRPALHAAVRAWLTSGWPRSEWTGA